ncbi:MAG TPA: hypothetical protein VEC35_01250 [Noviherbaspirillum sp.]|nr:hypothetical protein [Noviherbaspirillum sp.]
MDLEEFKEAKAAMEQEIRDAVTQAVAKFRGATHHTPYSISVPMLDVTVIGASRQYVVGQVKASVDID